MQQHILDSGHPLEGRSIGHVHDKSAPTVYGLRTSSPSGTCSVAVAAVFAPRF
ncbi:MAG: hypothetical protein ACJ788_05970 [Ktedonobacteraceae bacterium]